MSDQSKPLVLAEKTQEPKPIVVTPVAAPVTVAVESSDAKEASAAAAAEKRRQDAKSSADLMLSANVRDDVVLVQDLPKAVREYPFAWKRNMLKTVDERQRIDERPSTFPVPYSNGTQSFAQLKNTKVDMLDTQALFWTDIANAAEVKKFQTTEKGARKWPDVLNAGKDFPSGWPGPLFAPAQAQKAHMQTHTVCFQTPPDTRLADLLKGTALAAPGFSSHIWRSTRDNELPTRSDGQAVLLSAKVTSYCVSDNVPCPVSAALAAPRVFGFGGGKRYNVFHQEIVPLEDGQFGIECGDIRGDAQIRRIPEAEVLKGAQSLITTADGFGIKTHRPLLEPGSRYDCEDITLANMPQSYLQDPWVSRAMYQDFAALRRKLLTYIPKWDVDQHFAWIADIDPEATQFTEPLHALLLSQWSWLWKNTLTVLNRSETQDYIVARRKKLAAESNSTFASDDAAKLTKPLQIADSKTAVLFIHLRSALELINALERRVWKSNFLVNFDPLRLVLAVPGGLQDSVKKRVEGLRGVGDSTVFDPFVQAKVEVELTYVHNTSEPQNEPLNLHYDTFRFPNVLLENPDYNLIRQYDTEDYKMSEAFRNLSPFEILGNPSKQFAVSDEDLLEQLAAAAELAALSRPNILLIQPDSYTAGRMSVKAPVVGGGLDFSTGGKFKLKSSSKS